MTVEELLYLVTTSLLLGHHVPCEEGQSTCAVKLLSGKETDRCCKTVLNSSLHILLISL